MPHTIIRDSFDAFKGYAPHGIAADICDSGFRLAFATNMLKNINDAVHAKFAEWHAARIITFDQGFRKFSKHISIPIDVLP